jgi:hypothetical protein
MFILFVVLVVLLSTIPPVWSAESKPISPQAQRMKDCNAQAREQALAGDARKQFMSDCLRGSGAGRAERSSQGAGSPSEAGASSEPSSPGTR